jgi:hypothetical protein
MAEPLRPIHSTARVGMGQILVDLSNLGEKCISNGGYSAMHSGKNLDDAIEYLRRSAPKSHKASDQTFGP